MFVELRDTPIGPTVASGEQIDVPNFAKTPQMLRNFSGKLPKRADGRLNQFWVCIEVAEVVGVGQEKGRNQVRFSREG